MNQYEAMFVFDPTFGGAFEKCEAEIGRLMERAGGEIIICRKWDERRLAYRINGRKRGVYVLVYFKAAADKIVSLEHDAKLSEHILRLLVLRADGLTQEAMETACGARGDERSRNGDREDSPAPSPAAAKRESPAKQTSSSESQPAQTDTAVADKPTEQTTKSESPE